MGAIYNFLQGISRYCIPVLLLTVLNHSLKVSFLWFWDPGVQMVEDTTWECGDPVSKNYEAEFISR